MRLTRRIGLPNVTAPKLLRHQFATSLQEANVDPLIRNLLMGHASAGERSAGHGPGMTAVYTHTRPETIRKQLEGALAVRVALAMGERTRDVAAKHGLSAARISQKRRELFHDWLVFCGELPMVPVASAGVGVA